MKKKTSWWIIFLTWSMILGISGIPVESYATSQETHITKADKEMKGVWVATVLNLDYPSKPGISVEELKQEAIAMLDDFQAMGLNTVFLQVRPTGDSIYPSRYFPWSYYLTGKQGKALDGNFDILEFWVTEAHKRNLELHAWINPYRLSKKTKYDKNHDLSLFSQDSLVKKYPQWVVKHPDGNFYLDPGIPAVRQYIIDGVLEVVEKYDIDGIHLDDYFYPSTEFSDENTYRKYGGALTLSDFRRQSVDILIESMHQQIENKKKEILFGVSPFGIWANKQNNSLGSETKGLESYGAHYADTRKWVKNGYLDYIMPQLYWNIGYEIADYDVLAKWWTDVVKGTKVKLYIGQAAYRVGAKDVSDPWYGVTEIQKQLEYNQRNEFISGSVFFRAKNLTGNQSLFTLLQNWYKKETAQIKEPQIQGLFVARPVKDISTGYQSYYLNGASDPSEPLLLNGKPVENRSPNGYFGVLVSLKNGNNIFTFSQGARVEMRKIYCTLGDKPVPTNQVSLPTSSLFPQNPSYWQPGEKITLSCKAPIGSKVTVTLAGNKYDMKPKTTNPPAKGVLYTTFSYSYTIPGKAGEAKKESLGKPLYEVKYESHYLKSYAPSEVGYIMKGTPFYATVTSQVADTYDIANSGDGSRFEVYQGMRDLVTALSGNYARLYSGQWIKKEFIKLTNEKYVDRIYIADSQYFSGTKFDEVAFQFAEHLHPMTMSEMNEDRIELLVQGTDTTDKLSLPQQAPIELISQTRENNAIKYQLKVKTGKSIEGFFVQQTEKGISLFLKHPVKLSFGEKPLTGIRVLLDPGHGGTDTGALGPLGSHYAEKAINLDIGLKLAEQLTLLGAEVDMTRRSDIYLSLQERLAISRDLKPDLFISIHANSMNDNVDISKIDGFCVFYRESFGEQLAKEMLQNATMNLGLSNKGIQKRNFYVMRGTWTPSILFEAGFVPNPGDFEWLSNQEGQERFAREMAGGVVQYFERNGSLAISEN